MKFTALIVSAILILAPVRCQRRMPWRNLRQSRPYIDERLRNPINRAQPREPLKAAPEIPIPLRAEPVAPCRLQSPLQAVAKIAPNIPRPLPTTDYYQNVLLSPQVPNQLPEIPRLNPVAPFIPKAVERPDLVPEKIVHPALECPCNSPINPFLPAASPLLPWKPSNLPTLSSPARNHFLRKIPIPPPTL